MATSAAAAALGVAHAADAAQPADPPPESIEPPLGLLPNAADLIESHDQRFKALTTGALVERIARGFAWAEGPVWFSAGRYLLFSDIPNNRIMRLLEEDGHLSVFRQPAQFANGNTVDRRGRLYTCEQRGRRVIRTEPDGAMTAIAERYGGRKLNAPNDIVVASDESVWFTDPTYGLAEEMEQARRNVFRVDGRTGEISVVADDFAQPNGIALSRDERTLFVVDTESSRIRAFDVDIEAGRVSNGRIFADGFNSDGMRCDADGNIWCSVGYGDPKENGVRCYAADGALLGKILLPESVTNLTFGGGGRNRLYICGGHSLYACNVQARGAAPG